MASLSLAGPGCITPSTRTQACTHPTHRGGGRSPWPRATGAGRKSPGEEGVPPPHALGRGPQRVAEAVAEEEVRGGGEVQQGGKLGC